MLKALRRIIIECSPMMTGSACVIILRIALDIFDSDLAPVHITQKGYAKVVGFSPSCVRVALYEGEICKIFNVISDSNGGCGHMVSFKEGFLDG